MRRAGEVIGTAQGVAIVRCPDGDHPGIGAQVIDDRLERVGRIVDVFGPVERPYLAVTPARGREIAPLVGRVVYVR